MAVETNQTPLTMTPEEFGRTCSELAKRADATPPYSAERANLLDDLGRLWTEQGFTVLGQTWYDAAAYCRRGH